jgi:transglutaminase-like putative cysteine protease
VVTEAEIPLRTNEMRALHVSKAIGPIVSYTVTAVIPTLKPASLVGKGSDYPARLQRYLGLPFPSLSEIQGSDKDAAWRSMMADQGPEWAELYALNKRIVGESTDPYDKTLRIEQYLRKFFQYSLNPPASEYSSPYAAFLFDHHLGYCQHFSGSMALLLRFNGIPARVAVGFTSGELQRGSYTVSTNNAHAWVEVYFPQVGWVAFDPTPGRNIPMPGPSSTSPGFSNPFTGGGTTGSTTVATEPPRQQLPQEKEPTSDSEDGTSVWTRITWLPWVIGVVVVAVGWPAGRWFWRRRGLRRGNARERLEASLRLMRIELAEYGAPVGPALTTEETLLAVHLHLGLPADLDFASRTDAILFGNQPAGQQDVERAESVRREVKTRLRKRHGWLRTGLAWYGIPRRTPAEAGTS